MALFGLFSGAKKAAAAAAEARVAELTAALSGAAATVSVDRYHPPLPSTYTVAVLGTRREFPALVSRLGGAIEGLDQHSEIELRIAESAEPGAVFSTLLIPGWRPLDRNRMEHLLRAHERLRDRFPHHSLKIDGGYGSYTVSGVGRAEAVSVARLLVSWWEETLAADPGLWPESGIAVEIGGPEPEISYVLELEGPEDKSGHASPPEEQRAFERRAVAAWTGSLGDLEALAKVHVRHGYAVKLDFAPVTLQPRLEVEDLDTGIGDSDEAAEVASAIRFHNAASTIEA